MSDIYTNIQADLKKALKMRSNLELSTLRLLKSEIEYELNKTGNDSISDSEVQVILKRSQKKRNEAILLYEKAGRNDQAETERQELLFIKRYLPLEVTVEEINKTLEQIFNEMKPSGMSDMGRVMGRAMSVLKNKNVDGARIKELVEKKLQG